MAERPRHRRGILDTSVVIDLESIDVRRLPAELAITAITLAELAAGPHAGTDADEQARRQDRLQRAGGRVRPAALRHRVRTRVRPGLRGGGARGSQGPGARAVDLLIAATALAADLPVYTRNGSDFRVLEDLLEVVVV